MINLTRDKKLLKCGPSVTTKSSSTRPITDLSISNDFGIIGTISSSLTNSRADDSTRGFRATALLSPPKEFWKALNPYRHSPVILQVHEQPTMPDITITQHRP